MQCAELGLTVSHEKFILMESKIMNGVYDKEIFDDVSPLSIP